MAGPGPVIYLDVDDEITSAAARVRAVEGTRAALVVPPGSRIATSRINFRLLARDATLNGRRLAIVAPDAASRALAQSAGLEVFASVAEYETAMADPNAPPPPRPDTAAGGAAAVAGAAAGAGAAGTSAKAGAAKAGAAKAGAAKAGAAKAGAAKAGTSRAAVEDTAVKPAVVGGAAAAAAGAGADGSSEADLRPRSAGSTTSSVAGAKRRRFGVAGLLIVGAIVLGAGVVVAGVAGYLLLPSATVTVTPIEETLGPIDISVTADPEATDVDVADAVVPAETRTFEVAAEGTYEATGERVEETTATGSVRWQNCDPTASYTVAAGTVVRTPGGVRFTTDERVFLPVAILQPPNIDCQTRDVGVTAVAKGPDGNVAAAAITVIPGELNSVVLSVRNPAATSGGSRETFPLVTRADVDRALTDLDAKLEVAFTEAMAAPDAVPPSLTLFPETGELGDSVPEGDPAELVGQEVATFEVAATATGTAIAVDEEPVGEVAAAQLRESVSPGYVLVADSVETTIGDPTVDAQTVVFPASAVGKEVRVLDAAELETLVLGLTPEAAEEALAEYGTVEVSLSPDWATTIPTYAFRVEVIVDDGGRSGSPAASPVGPSGGPSTTPARSPSATPSGAPSASPS